MSHPDDINTNLAHSIEEDSDGDDEHRDITNEIQLERFIRVLQTAQQIACEQEQEKADMRKREKVYKTERTEHDAETAGGSRRTSSCRGEANHRYHGHRTLPPE